MELTFCSWALTGLLVLLTIYLLRYYTYWKRRSVPSAEGLQPLFGHLLPVILARTSMSDVVTNAYDNNKDKSMVGMFSMQKPLLLIREPALVKTVMQANFNSFHENAAMVDPNLDPLLANNPFFIYGEAWQSGRKRLTYAFSSMRLRILFEAVHGVTKKLDNYLKKQIGTNGTAEVELKDLFSKYTGEVVANAGLGVEGFCFDDNPNSGSFQRLGKEFFDPCLKNAIAQILIFVFPQLNKLLKISLVPKKLDGFFRGIVKDVLENRRKEDSVPRNDFFQVMMDMEKTHGEKLSEDLLAAHTFSFFADGYETSSITLSFVGYQLAVHREIQDKLREEINRVLEKHNGSLTYDAVKEMTYMDQVINESQRIHPVTGFLMKRCTENFELKGSDGLSCNMKPQMEVVIPLSGLHMDPKYWPDPKVFDPDRFSDERKKDIEKFTFLPFGEGPRMCVGMRMALLQTKACLAALLKDYSLELSPRTQLPIQLSKGSILPYVVGGIWVNIKHI